MKGKIKNWKKKRLRKDGSSHERKRIKKDGRQKEKHMSEGHEANIKRRKKGNNERRQDGRRKKIRQKEE